MTHLDTQLEAIGKSDLELMLPKPGAITVATSGVGQNEQILGVWIFDRTDLLPPNADGSHGKLGSIPACAQVDKALVATKIIDAVRDGNARSIGWKIMVKDCNGLFVPCSSGLMKRSGQLAAFGVNADHRQNKGIRDVPRIYGYKIRRRGGSADSTLIVDTLMTIGDPYHDQHD